MTAARRKRSVLTQSVCHTGLEFLGFNCAVYGRKARGCIANLDYDPGDTANSLNLDMLIRKWLHEEIPLPEDLNRDGKVNLADFAILAELWQSDI